MKIGSNPCYINNESTMPFISLEVLHAFHQIFLKVIITKGTKTWMGKQENYPPNLHKVIITKRTKTCRGKQGNCFLRPIDYTFFKCKCESCLVWFTCKTYLYVRENSMVKYTRYTE